MQKEELRKALRESYDSLAPFSAKYRVDFKRYLFTLELISKIPEIEQKKILDIGTGIGLVPTALMKLGLNATGLDYYIFPEGQDETFGIPEIKHLKEIWQKNGVTVIEKNIYQGEPLADGKHYDVLTSEAMIEHLKDPRAFLKTVYDLLAPQGYFILTTPNSATLLKRLRFLIGRTPNWPIEDFFKSGEKFTGHWREYTGKELRYMCEASGFEIVSYYNKNLLAGFKESNWQKNLRALIAKLSWLIPGAREMHYVLAQKK